MVWMLAVAAVGCWGFVVGARRMRKESNDRIGSLVLVGRRIRPSVAPSQKEFGMLVRQGPTMEESLVLELRLESLSEVFHSDHPRPPTVGPR
jgi:hypothetical protein